MYGGQTDRKLGVGLGAWQGFMGNNPHHPTVYVITGDGIKGHDDVIKSTVVTGVIVNELMRDEDVC